jgi:FlaG/FlaF family flagellin (archaellin)
LQHLKISNMTLTYTGRIVTLISALALASCDDDEVSHLRPSIDYSQATAETPYSELFVDTNGATTVDLTEGNSRHKMFQALNYYSTSSVSAKTHIDAAKLKSMFSNSGNPFSDISTSTISVVGAELNASDVQLKDIVASSKSASEADAVRAKIESLFNQIDAASNSVNATASQGVAGKLGNYLVDAKGIEIAQIIQKSLIGALELDYIGNVLLDKGLTADNHSVVGDNNYTQLEHNWDEAYGLLTLNPIYLAGSTNDARGTTEFGAGSYIWEYNKANFANIYPAFLKGRVAIVNNDVAEYQTQALFIRTEFEKALAAAALGYLEKWKTGADDAARAHAMGEGLGFIYSLRFATVHGADAAFSDAILTNLIESPNGFWDLTVTKINTAADAIKDKFDL